MVEPTQETSAADQLLHNQTEQIYQKTRVRKYILYTLVLPPVGLLLAFRGKALHLVLPSYLAAESVFFALSIILTLMTTKPALELLKLETGNIFTGFYWATLLLVTIILIIAGLVAGFYYKHEVKKTGYIKGAGLAVLVVILLLHYLVSFLIALYLNDRLLGAIGDLNPLLDNLNETQELLQP